MLEKHQRIGSFHLAHSAWVCSLIVLASGLVWWTQSARAASDPRWATCDQFQNERSRNSDNPVTVTFINRSGAFRSVMWVDFNGRPTEYAALNDGERFTINTYLSHPWMFTDGPGNCIEMYMPVLGVSQFQITAPSRYFGDE